MKSFLKFNIFLSMLFFYIGASAQYCIPTYGDPNCNYGDFIQSFSTTGGSTNITNFGSGCSTGGVTGNYTYFSGPSNTLTLMQGASFNFNLSINAYYPEGIIIWADWNHDFVFDSIAERIYFSTTVLNAGGAAIGSAVVPNNAVVGQTRIRARAVFNNPNFGPCSYYMFGEVEDYDLLITQNSALIPLANFTSSSNNIMAGQSVNFNDLSTNNPTFWNWTFTGATTTSSTAQNPTNIVYNTPGCYEVSLTATNNSGSNTYTQVCYITVVNPPNSPVANFTSNTQNISVGQSVNFTDLSTNNSTAWYWFFTGAATSSSNVQNPSNITYNTPGCFPVTLTAMNSGGSNTFTQTCFVHVSASVIAPVANFTANTFNINVGQSVNFTDLSLNNPTQLFWNFDGGLPAFTSQQNPSNVTYNAPGCYQVKLTATNSAGNNISIQPCYINVTNTIITPVANFTASSLNINIGQSVNFTDLSTNSPTSWNWTFTGAATASSTAQNPINIVYNTPGCYQVSLTATNSAGNNISTQTCYITVNNSTNPSYCIPTYSDPNCNYGDFIQSFSTSGGSTNITNFGSGCSTGGVTGNYAYFTGPSNTLTVMQGASFNFNLSINAYYPEAIIIWADWNHDLVFDSLAERIYFSTTVLNAGGAAIGSAIVPNNAVVGQTRMRAMIVFNNSNFGPCGYNLLGEVEDYDIVITQNPALLPVANFNSSTVNILTGQSVNFNDLSTNNPTSWNWTFTGGLPASSTAQNPTNIVYNTPGCYQVSFTATNSAGSNTVSQVCYINVTNPPNTPVANFTVNTQNISVGQSVNFTDLSTNNPTAWNWSFTGASTSSSNIQNPTNITYNTPGCFPVTLTAMNSGGSNTITQTCFVHVSASTIAPVANFTANTFNINVGQSVNFTDLSLNNPTQLFWNFDGGLPAFTSQQNPSNVTYNTPGCYQVKLTATNSAGTNVSIQPCYINVSNTTITPVANFTASSFNITTGQSVNFTDLSTNNPSSWNWTFTGGTPVSSSVQNPTNIVYNTPGCYQVSLTATNSAGSNTSTQTCYITVSNPIITPVANFTANTQYITVGQSVNFTDLSTNNPTSWNWVFTGAAPASSTSQNPTIITYNTAGCYEVALTATNSAGSNTSTQTCFINVVPAGIQPQADFNINPNPACTNADINLINTSTNALTFNWEMNGANPSTSSVQFPIINYAAAGIYQIKLIAINGANSDTLTQTINVNPTPVMNTSADESICFGSSTTLNASASGTVTYNWIPSATLTTPNQSSTIATPTVNTDYIITISDALCSASDTITVTVWPLPIAPNITQVGNTLEATSGFPTYQWYENNVIIAGETQSTITPLNNGNYTVDAIDTNGCISTSQDFPFVIQGMNSVSNNDVNIYPNPTSTILNIDLMNLNEFTQIEISNLQGQIVISETTNKSTNKFNLEQISAGIYIIKISTNNQIMNVKLVKQ